MWNKVGGFWDIKECVQPAENGRWKNVGELPSAGDLWV